MTELHLDLKYMREELGLTLKEVAEMTGMSVSYISDIENGKSLKSLAAVEKIVSAFGCYIAIVRLPGERN